MTTSFHKANNEPWPTPLELLDLQDAVNQRKKTVLLSDKKFRIRYDKDRFFVQPVSGFVPCGEFEYKTAFAILEEKDA